MRLSTPVVLAVLSATAATVQASFLDDISNTISSWFSSSSTTSTPVNAPIFVSNNNNANFMPAFVNDQKPISAVTSAPVKVDQAQLPQFVALKSNDVPVFVPVSSSVQAVKASAVTTTTATEAIAIVAATTTAAAAVAPVPVAPTTAPAQNTSANQNPIPAPAPTTTSSVAPPPPPPAPTTTPAAPVTPPSNLFIYTNENDPRIQSTAYTVVLINFWTPTYQPSFDPSTLQSLGKKVLISAYGGNEAPTTAGRDATTDANLLADYVIANNLDGVDVDWEDGEALKAGGGGEAWLITLTTQLRARLPSPRYIITHAPQAPHFSPGMYTNGAYLTVDREVGWAIDYYLVQFYNQGGSSYDSCESLFYKANGWAGQSSVFEIAAQGVPLNKIVVGKPVTQAGVEGASTGYIDPWVLEGCVSGARANGWNAGVMGWRFGLDTDGSWAATLAPALGL
ncbi:glycoside hydrolase [Rhizoclosmatium globosum]|uniref:Glycoside hydrolase n=1 Tax=Rhizoclosmatium globosum TaxID=329046 RepID=A0A1Y2BIR9_9FUNG|nr:glycoside hydrolase [Rhizoclosmatium globosum]|eukprot:ORY34457.1 glycoside hydrolase [Rhizoclosmatium globosum]